MSEDFLDFIRLVSCLFLFLLINKEFHVISFTNGYTDELVIKTKKPQVNPGLFYLPQGIRKSLCGGKHLRE